MCTIARTKKAFKDYSNVLAYRNLNLLNKFIQKDK